MGESIQRQLAAGFESFWSRFDERPALEGKRVLEVGCGNGALCMSMARAGAAEVTGVDIRADDVRAATDYVRREIPRLADVLRFTTEPVAGLPPAHFDLIVSKDAFEHIIDVPGMLRAIARCLAPGGAVYIGFSPLYHSPYGDHDRRRTAFRTWGPLGRMLALVPWGHLLLEPLVLRRHRSIQEHPVHSMHDLNLNTMSIQEFRRFIADAGLRPRHFATNRGDNLFGKMLAVAGHVPMFTKYCTYNAYCILTR